VLYAEVFDISELQLTIYPGHVALHFHGVDIETTSGRFALYNKEGQYRAPAHEIVSVNLLDTTDVNYTKSMVNPEVFLQAARLAYVVSSNRAIVKQNLEVAYRNTVSRLLRDQNYKKALIYAKQSRDQELISIAGHSGAVNAMQQHDFSAARNFGGYSLKKHELLRMIDHNEAVWLFNAKQYESAVKAYQRIGDQTMVRRCYEALYYQAQRSLTGVRTVADLKSQANTVRTMERYAKLSMNNKLIQHVTSLTKHL
jgi:tetratricopeptide (TPR) repeat protein